MKIMDPERTAQNTGKKSERDVPAIDAADYIADVSLQLRNIANRHNLTFLAYLLAMVFQEAYSEAGKRPLDHDG